jgi:hypothetical protein
LTESESNKEPIYVFSFLNKSVHISREIFPFGGEKKRPSGEHLTHISEIERDKHGELGHIDVHVAVFISGHKVTLEMDWSISNEVIVIFGLSISGKIGHEKVCLLNHIESSKEAVGRSISIRSWISLESKNPSV